MNSNARSGASIGPSAEASSNSRLPAASVISSSRSGVVRFDRGADEPAMGHRHCGVTRRIRVHDLRDLLGRNRRESHRCRDRREPYRHHYKAARRAMPDRATGIHRQPCATTSNGAILPVSPHAEQKSAARPQHAPRFTKRSALIGKEHDAELAQHVIELPIAERQCQRVRLPPLHALEPGMGFRSVEHGRVQIGRRDCDLRRQSPRQRARRRLPCPPPIREPGPTSSPRSRSAKSVANGSNMTGTRMRS